MSNPVEDLKALFAALILLFGVMAIVCWIADIIRKWHNKRHPQPKRKPLSITDFPINEKTLNI